MNNKKIIEYLKHIETIAKFQQERLKDKKSVMKGPILSYAVECIISYGYRIHKLKVK